MRKAEPNLVVDDFHIQLKKLQSYFDRVKHALVGTANEKRDISQLAEQVFVTASVAMEGFFSDWFIAAVNRDSSAIQNEYETRIKEQAKSKYGEWFSKRLLLQSVSHIPMAEVRTVLDSKGYNITFHTFADLKSKAATHLVTEYKTAVQGFSKDDERLVDTVKTIRDYIVHRSTYSSNRMNESLESIETGNAANQGLGRGPNKITNVGAFLKSACQMNTRLKVYLDRMIVTTQALYL